MTTDKRRQTYAAIGAAMGMLKRYVHLENPPAGITHWIDRIDTAVTHYLIKNMQMFSWQDIAAIRDRLNLFFENDYPVNTHILTYMAWSIAIMDDLGIRDDRFKKILDMMCCLETALKTRHPGDEANTEHGAEIANRWGELWR